MLRSLILPFVVESAIAKCTAKLFQSRVAVAAVMLRYMRNRLRERHPSLAFTLGFRHVWQSYASECARPGGGGAAARSEFGRSAANLAAPREVLTGRTRWRKRHDVGGSFAGERRLDALPDRFGSLAHRIG